MDTPTLVGNLDALGFKLRIDGDLLLVEPGSRLTDALAQEIRVHKPAIIEYQADLTDRLRKGIDWLSSTSAELLAMTEPNAGVGSWVEALFVESLDLWDRLERQLRAVYGFPGCVMDSGEGQQCPDRSPVRCLACVSRQATHTNE